MKVPDWFDVQKSTRPMKSHEIKYTYKGRSLVLPCEGSGSTTSMSLSDLVTYRGKEGDPVP